MLNTKEFAKLHDSLEEFDNSREEVIKKSRSVLKLSKELIYATHRNELNKAGKLKEEIKKEIVSLTNLTKKQPALYYSGSLKIAEQEFVEAVCFYEFVKNSSLPTAQELNVDLENYLLGLCDLVGELMRRATNSAIKEKYDESIKIREFVSELYEELMKFDFRNSELRRKFDGLKYEVKKIEALILELKLKDKI